jgi:hypothetical protein
MRPLLISAATLVGGLTLALSSITSAQAASYSYGVTGNDVSWPQCVNDTKTQGPLPASGAFGIVGVNDGLANTTNPCFGTELAWAQKITASSSQPPVQLYVNTANPGKQAAYWPKSNISQLKTPVAVPKQYGTCDGKPSNAACAYVYGWSMAENDARIRNVSDPGSYFWWLDVETDATWSKAQATNRAALEGMVTYLASINATGSPHNVGVYSTEYQWGRIAGTAPSGSPLVGLPSWLAGARSQDEAATMCATSAGLTSGSEVRLVQYLPGGFDFDLSCTD